VLGDLSIFGKVETQIPLFRDYAHTWISQHVEIECRQSTARSYEQLLRVHIMPRFGQKRLTEIKREQIKKFVAELSQMRKIVNDLTEPKLSRNTLRLILCVLRGILNAGLEDGLILANPASRMGRFVKSEKPAHQATAMTRDDAERFLTAVDEVCPEWWSFFLATLRAGLRKSELIALKWGDIQFGESAEDPNRYILVQRNWSHARFTTPKSKKSRRVDLSKQLRGVLMDLRDKRLLAAMMNGKTSIADELIFPSHVGTVFKAAQYRTTVHGACASESWAVPLPLSSEAFIRLATDPGRRISRLHIRSRWATAQFKSPWTCTGI
jgi:integrase